MAVIALALLPACDTDPAPVTPGCTLASTHGLRRVNLGHRSYLVSVPSGLAGREASGVPMVMGLHGLGSTAWIFAGYTPFDDPGGPDVISVYPQAENGTWRIGPGSADVAFLREVVADVRDDYCVARQQVHVTGHSLGGFMALRMACDAPDVVASVTEYAGGSPGTCTPSRPIAVALFHGSSDGTVRVSAGRTARDEWVRRLGCDPVPVADGGPGLEWLAFKYTGCRGGVEVRWREYPEQGHFWPSEPSRAADIRDRMLAHFARFTLPS